MRKPELAAAVATKANLSKAKAAEALTALTDEVTEAVALNQVVSIPGLGSFSQRQRKARAGVNPQTGAPLEIPANKTVVFRAAAALKDAVNKS